MMTKDLTFDFTNYNEDGFLQIPAGRYDVVTQPWKYRTSESGNPVFHIDVEFTGGQFKGETMRYFHTIMPEEWSKGAFLRMLKEIGVVKQDDHKKGEKLTVIPLLGETDEREFTEVTHIEVNGDKRTVDGRKAVAVIVPGKDKQGNANTMIQRLEKAGSKPASDMFGGSGSTKKSDFPV